MMAQRWCVRWAGTARSGAWRVHWSTPACHWACCPAVPGTCWRATLGFQSTTPQDPWTLVLNGTPRKIDVGAVTWDDAEEVFVVMAGMGMDARMMGDADERIKNAVGWPAYLLSGVRALFDPGFTVRASTRDQQEESHRARMVVVGNCTGSPRASSFRHVSVCWTGWRREGWARSGPRRIWCWSGKWRSS